MQDKTVSNDNIFSSDKLNIATAFNHIAQDGAYDALYTSPRCKAEDQLLGDYLDRVLPDGGRVLDVGCGTGLLLRLVSASLDYTGVDISAVMIARAEARHPTARFVLGDVERLPMPDASFDAVTALYGTPSYWTNPLQALREIHRVLRPGGMLWLMPYTLRWFRDGIGVMGDVNIITSPAPWTVRQAHRRLLMTRLGMPRLMGFSVLPTCQRLDGMLGCLFPTAGRYMIVHARKAG